MATSKPADDAVASPPAPGEGFIAKVNFKTKRAGPLSPKDCQQCGTPVDRETPYIRATVWLDGDLREVMHTPVFCDKNCWASWASRE